MIDIRRVLADIREPWRLRDLARANDASLRVARLFRIELDGRDPVTRTEGPLFLVPRGASHRPFAEEDAVTLLLERPDTKQYGTT